MPTVTETAKDATYTVIGVPVLFFDEIGARLAPRREQLTERFNTQRQQLDTRFNEQRDHLSKRLDDQRKQLEEQLELAREHATKARARVKPATQKTFDAAEPTFRRITDVAPMPIDGYMQDGFSRVRLAFGLEEPVEADSDNGASDKDADIVKDEEPKATATKAAAPKASATKSAAKTKE